MEKKQAILKVKSIIIRSMRFTFLFCLSLLLGMGFLRAEELCLKNLLVQAQSGSYLVTEQNKNFTFLHVFQNDRESIILEEVTIPASRFPKNFTWKEWFESGAKGHTAWVMTQINLNTGKCEEAFSFTHQGWLDLSHSDHFLATLLNLKFSSVPNSERRRLGLPPAYHKVDKRPFWNPPLIVEGKVLIQIPFTVWKTRWPSDGSELARKNVEIYLPDATSDESLPAYPSYFPYWLEIEGKVGSAKVRVVDSGMTAKSPKNNFPLRPPQLLGNVALTEEGLTLRIKTPPYYKEFILMAEEKNHLFEKTFLLPCQTYLEGSTAKIQVSANILPDYLTVGETYTIILSPQENPRISLETQPFAFQR